MLDALKKRIAEIETAHRALPSAAIAIANTLRRAVSKRRSAARKERIIAKALGGFVKPKRRTSGVPIRVVATNDQVTVSASRQVHHIGRAQNEPAEWAQTFRDKVVAAAKGE